jgi:hypothetical protein
MAGTSPCKLKERGRFPRRTTRVPPIVFCFILPRPAFRLFPSLIRTNKIKVTFAREGEKIGPMNLLALLPFP